MRLLHLTLVAALALPAPACLVRKEIHDAALDTIAETEDQLQALRGELERAAQDASALEGTITERENDILRLQRVRDELLARNQALTAQLDAAGQDIEGLADRTADMEDMLAEATAALEEARRRQAMAEQRDAEFRRLKASLQEMIEAGKLNVRVVRGRIVLDLKQDILFPSGRARLSDIGEETLAQVATALSEFPTRHFQVEGHTDDVPIKTERFPSNWELSTARALSVVKLFVSRGMDPENLSAAGYGEFQPRADNASSEGRALNRRIEVVMTPDLQALPDLVEGL